MITFALLSSGRTQTKKQTECVSVPPLTTEHDVEPEPTPDTSEDDYDAGGLAR